MAISNTVNYYAALGGLDVMVLPKWTKVFFIAAINFDINVRAMPCHKGQYVGLISQR
jgi:hypothetical protein